MKILSTLLFLALVTVSMADAPLVLVDVNTGATYPSNSVATPQQIASISESAGEVASSATNIQSATSSLLSTAQNLSARMSLYSTNYVVKSVCWVEGVGSVNFDASNQILRITGFTTTATSLVVYAVAKLTPLGNSIPALEWRSVLGSSGSWSNLNTYSSSEIEKPAGYESFAKAYRYELVKPAGSSAFFRLVDNSTGISGSGWYWLVYGDIIVNQDGLYYRGRSTVTTNIVANVTNIVRLVSGLDVELEPLGGM